MHTRRQDAGASIAGSEVFTKEVNPAMERIETASSSARRHDLDWLRILAVLLLVPFHCALVFAPDPRFIMFVKDVVESRPLLATANFMNLWHMPLFFVIAGASTWFSLRRRAAGQYLRERVLRLFVPLVFGMLVLVPPMTYLGRTDHPSFWAHYLGFFRFDPADLTGDRGMFTPGHLWFILSLLVFSTAALPLFLSLASTPGRRFTAALSSAVRMRGMLLLGFLPLALTGAVPMLGDRNPLHYLHFILLFMAGFLLMTEAGFQQAIDRDWWIYLLIALALTPIFFRQEARSSPMWSPEWVVTLIVFYLARWTWVLAILGLGHRFLNAASGFLFYCSEGAYPFYLLHLPINMLIAFFVIRWPVGIGVKYLCIVLLTYLLTLAVYELLVRRWHVMRFLLGMKPQAKPSQDAIHRGTLNGPGHSHHASA